MQPPSARYAHIRTAPGALAGPGDEAHIGRATGELPQMGILNDLKAALARRRFDPERAYIDEATSFADLELRQREIDRGRFRKSR